MDEVNMSDACCALCGKDLSGKRLKYIVHITIISDFDGSVPCEEDHPSDGVRGLLPELNSPGALGDAGCQELSLYLCTECKKIFARDLVSGEGEDLYAAKKDFGTVYH